MDDLYRFNEQLMNEHGVSTLTFRNEDTNIACHVLRSKGFHDSVDLLCFTRKADLHEHLSKGNVNGYIKKVKLANKRSQCLCIESISTINDA